MKKNLNLALIGFGGQMSGKLAPATQALGCVTIAAVCDLDSSRLAEARAQYPGAVVYADAGGFTGSSLGLLDQAGLNAVIAAITPQGHHKIGSAAAKSHLPVFLEKPPCATLSGLHDLAAMAGETGVATGVGMNFRHAWGVRRVIDFAARPDAEGIARVHIEHTADKPRGSLWGLPPRRSFCLAQAIHPLDLAHYLCDGPVRRMTCTVREVGRGMELNALLEFPGQVATIQTGSASPHFRFRLSVVCGNGDEVETDLWKVTLRKGGAGKRQEVVEKPSPFAPGFEMSGYGAELTAFFDAVRGERLPENAFAGLIPTYRLIEEICHDETHTNADVVEFALAERV